MRFRVMGAAWVAVAVVFALLLLYEFTKWRSLGSQGAKASAEIQRLKDEVRLREGQLVAEMRGNAGLLQEMQWTGAGGDPAAYLNRLAELAKEKRIKVLAIGPLERQVNPQFSKTWHTIQVQAPYREIRDLTARVEQEKGIVEELNMSLAATPTGDQAAGAPSDEVLARFRMTALELSAQARQVIDRAMAASGGASGQPGAGQPALPVPTLVAQMPPLGRDPFFFAGAAASARRPAGQPGAQPPAGETPPPEKPPVPVDIKGIVSFPDGYLAIVNNQIVKIGDTVSGLRVERITENSVTLRDPEAKAARTVELPNLLGPAPAAPRR